MAINRGPSGVNEGSEISIPLSKIAKDANTLIESFESLAYKKPTTIEAISSLNEEIISSQLLNIFEEKRSNISTGVGSKVFSPTFT